MSRIHGIRKTRLAEMKLNPYFGMKKFNKHKDRLIDNEKIDSIHNSGENMKKIHSAVLAVAVLLAGTLFFSASVHAAGAQAQKSVFGTFAGTNPTITIGGNCPPLNARMEVTGKCEGTASTTGSCGSIPSVSSSLGIYQSASASPSCGYNWRGWCGTHSTSGSFATGESCSASGRSINDCQGCSCGRVDASASCTATSTNNQEGRAFSSGYSNCASTGCSATTYYTPCTRDPQVSMNGGTWKYSGLVKDTQTVSIPIGTNSNPSSSPAGYVGVKVPMGNILPGSNTLALSALGVNKFGYTVYWTEETVPGGGDADGDGYYTNQCTLGNDCNDLDANVNPGRAEVAGNGKDDNCDGYVDTLFINSMADITTYCPYDSGARTYSCTGWENIYVQNDVDLPTAECWYSYAYGSNVLAGCNPNNIVFKANNEFSAKNFYATNGGGYGGFINIEAKKITASSLNVYGAMCMQSSCTQDGPYCTNSNGGDVTLKADTVNVGTINANQGGGSRGSGGKVDITANKTTVTNIYSNGGGYGGCYSGNGGNGGTVLIKSGSSTVNSISVSGGYNGEWYVGGTSGGNVKLSSNSMNLGTIAAGGSTGSQYGQGAGGNIKIYNDAYTLSSISASGPGGYIAFFTDAAYPTALSAGTIKTGKRTGSGFFVFETNIPSQYISYRAKLKDFMGQYVKSIYNVEWSQTGAIKNGKISDFMGAMTKMNIKIGNDYTLEVTASPDALFDETRCAGRCAAYGVPFNVY